MRSINRLLIRCDASSTIGTGHLMRSLVLAKRLNAVNTVFAMRNLEGNLTDRVQQEGFDVSILQTDEITELIDVITNLKADAVVIDHYDIDVDQERQIREATSVFLIVLDDACARHYADLLINHNIYAREEDYKGLVPDFTRFWCGQEHALLREEFLSARGLEKTRHEIPQVVIAMGGADTQNISIPVAKEVLKHTNANVHILSTSANANLAGP